MPTQIIAEKEFVEQVTKLSHLPATRTHTILDRLTFNAGRKADILLTPFLRGEGSVCWSPIGILKYAHQRNLLKVMSRGAKDLREHAATVNGKRDRKLGRLIGNKFADYGYQFKLDTSIAADGVGTDVDVLLYQTSRPNEILIIETKALIAPDEINEVYDATQTLVHAQEQVHRAAQILRAMPAKDKQQKFKFVNWDRVTQFYGVVITMDAEAYSVIDPREVPVVTYNSLLWRFRPRDLRYPGRFWSTCVQRPWQVHEIEEEDHAHGDIKIGDLVYRLPVSVVSTSKEGVGIQKIGQLMTRRDKICAGD